VSTLTFYPAPLVVITPNTVGALSKLDLTFQINEAGVFFKDGD